MAVAVVVVVVAGGGAGAAVSNGVRVFVLVLIVAVAALFLGRWSVPRSPKQRADVPRAPIERAEAAPRVALERAAESAPAPAAREPEPPSDPLVPTRAATRAGHGLLELRGHRNGEGFDELNVLRRGLVGDWNETEFDFPEAGPVYLELEPGRYRVSVRIDVEPGPRLYRVDVRDGETCVVDLGAPATPELFPLAEGLGRVDVRVVDAAGAPIPDVQVGLHARDESIEHSGTESGCVRFDVLPGTYRLTAGALEHGVAVESGRWIEVRLDGSGTAELTIGGPLYRHIGIGSRDSDKSWETIGEELATRHVLMAPGRYDIYCYLQPGNRANILETVTLAAGDRYRIDPPMTGVFVLFQCRGARGPIIPPGRIRVENAAGKTEIGTAPAAILFAPGEYTATLRDTLWESDTVRFRADGERVTVTLNVRAR